MKRRRSKEQPTLCVRFQALSCFRVLEAHPAQLDTMLSVSFTKPSPVHSLSDDSPLCFSLFFCSASRCMRTSSVCVVKYWREALRSNEEHNKGREANESGLKNPTPRREWRSGDRGMAKRDVATVQR